MSPTQRDVDTAAQLASIESKLDTSLWFAKWGFGGFALLVISWLAVLSALHLHAPEAPHHSDDQCNVATYAPLAINETVMAQ